MSKPNVQLKMRLFAIGVTQRELAERIGISAASMSSIVQGKSNPSLSTARKIARELGVTIEELWPENEK